jgi:hypothetical protein
MLPFALNNSTIFKVSPDTSEDDAPALGPPGPLEETLTVAVEAAELRDLSSEARRRGGSKATTLNEKSKVLVASAEKQLCMKCILRMLAVDAHKECVAVSFFEFDISLLLHGLQELAELDTRYIEASLYDAIIVLSNLLVS